MIKEKLLKKRDWKIIPMTPGEILLERVEGRGYSYKIVKAENMPYGPTPAEKIDFGAVKPKSEKITKYIKMCWLDRNPMYESDNLQAKRLCPLKEKIEITDFILRESIEAQLGKACKYFCIYEWCWLKVTSTIKRAPGSQEYLAHVQVMEREGRDRVSVVDVLLTQDAQILGTICPPSFKNPLYAKLPPIDIFRERNWKIVKGGHIKKTKMPPELTKEELTNFRKSKLSWTKGKGQRAQYVRHYAELETSNRNMPYLARKIWLQGRIRRKFKGLVGYGLSGNFSDVKIYPDLDTFSAKIVVKGITFQCKLVGKKRKKLVVE